MLTLIITSITSTIVASIFAGFFLFEKIKGNKVEWRDELEANDPTNITEWIRTPPTPAQQIARMITINARTAVELNEILKAVEEGAVCPEDQAANVLRAFARTANAVSTLKSSLRTSAMSVSNAGTNDTQIPATMTTAG